MGTIFIDEAQTLFQEKIFRSDITEGMKYLSDFSITVTFLSGTFPIKAVAPFMKYFCLENYTVIESKGSISDITLDYVEVQNDILKYACDVGKAKLKQNHGDVQVICAFETECLAIKQCMQDNGIKCSAMTGRSDEDNPVSQQDIANWKNGTTEVLVSTTAGLVGNKSEFANRIIFVRPMFDNAFLFKASTGFGHFVTMTQRL